MYNRSEKEEEYFLRKEMERLKAIREEHARRTAVEERQKLKDLHFMHCAKCGQRMETTTLTDVEVELARVKRELALVRMERDILKKAAAYFAKESLHGTR